MLEDASRVTFPQGRKNLIKRKPRSLLVFSFAGHIFLVEGLRAQQVMGPPNDGQTDGHGRKEGGRAGRILNNQQTACAWSVIPISRRVRRSWCDDLNHARGGRRSRHARHSFRYSLRRAILHPTLPRILSPSSPLPPPPLPSFLPSLLTTLKLTAKKLPSR